MQAVKIKLSRLGLIAPLLCGSAAGADGAARQTVNQQIVLANGSVLVGTAAVSDDQRSVTVQTEDGIVLELPRGELRAAIPPNPAVEDYKKRAARMTDTAELHENAARWANEVGLGDAAIAHYQRMVELDPSNRSAWAALKYQETFAGWIPRDRYWRSKGMVREGGRWRIPQDVAIAELEQQRKRVSYEIGRTVSGAIRDLKTGGTRASAARQTLQTLNDPNAIAPLVEAIGEAGQNDELRSLLIDALMAIDSPAVTTAIAGILVEEKDAMIRHRCIDYLDSRPHEAALQKLQSYLTNNNPLKDRAETINNAAEAIAVLGDIRSVPRLMDVLITKHRQEVSQ